MIELFKTMMTWVAQEVPPAINSVVYLLIVATGIYRVMAKKINQYRAVTLVNAVIWAVIIAMNYGYIQAGALPSLWQSGFFRVSVFGMGVSVLLIIGEHEWVTMWQSLLRLFRAALGCLQRLLPLSEA